MITKNFTIDSETFTSDGYCDTLEVEINITSKYGDCAEWDIEGIWNSTQEKEVKFKELNDEDKEKIETMAQDYADDNAYEAYHEHMVALADFRRDD